MTAPGRHASPVRSRHSRPPAANGREPAELDRLMRNLYAELNRLARSYLRSERSDHTLQPTALVHEAYVRLRQDKSLEYRDRASFVGIAARVMRQVLVAHARRRAARKRGGGSIRLDLDPDRIATEQTGVDLLALDEALEELGRRDARALAVVELRYFGGLTIPETARVVGVSHATVERSWCFARAWLHRQIRIE